MNAFCMESKSESERESMPVNAMERITPEVAVRHIEKYFETAPNGRPQYSGSRFENFEGGGDVVEPNRITAADLIAVSMLSVHVPGQAALGILEELGDKIADLLAQVPVGLRLGELSAEEFSKFLDTGSPADKLWQLLRQRDDTWGVGQTTASKIIARKRPHLVPIYDSVVAEQTGLHGSGGQWRIWWKAFQGEAGQAFTERIEGIREAAGQPQLSLLRVIDIVLWMEGRGGERTHETVGDGE